MKSHLLGSITLVVAMLATAPLAPAQSRPDGPPADRPVSRDEGRPPQRRGLQPGSRLQGAAMDRVLTEDQRESMRESMQANREEIRALQEKIRDARQAMIKAALSEEFSETKVRTKANQVAKLEAEVAIMRLKALSDVQPPLSKEQLDQILNPAPPQGMRMQPGERSPNRRENQLRRQGTEEDDRPRPRRRVEE